MPESLTRRESAYVNLWGVRLHVGMASGFSSERCPASPRNRVRLQVGIASGIASEYLAGISRNLQPPAARLKLWRKLRRISLINRLCGLRHG
jgi:hypothetical protein